MPICPDCHGTGQREIKKEIMTQCPDCNGAKLLPDGTTCKRCNKWGEIGTGEFQVEMQLCTTCWGSGKVSERSITTWFLLRVVPATLLLLGVGGAIIWASWNFLETPLVTGLLIILFFGSWGGLMRRFIGQMPTLGEISVTNWFLIRTIPTTLVAIAVGGSVVWISWVYGQSPLVTVILALITFGVWGAFMYYFISHLPE